MELGHYQAALDLFRGALESKMKSTIGVLPRHDDDGLSQPDMDPATPSGITQAEHHMSNLSTYLSERSSVTIPLTRSVCLRSDVDDDTIVIPPSCRGSDPYLYRTPISLPETTSASSAEDDPCAGVGFSTQLTCCIIVFNLALVHQTMDRNRHSVVQFYAIANALLMSCDDVDADEGEEALFEIETQVVLLRLAIYNNYSVCCYENYESECMVVYLECLDRILNEEPLSTIAAIDAMDPLVIQGIQSNIRSILKPDHGNSAAA